MYLEFNWGGDQLPENFSETFRNLNEIFSKIFPSVFLHERLCIFEKIVLLRNQRVSIAITSAHPFSKTEASVSTFELKHLPPFHRTSRRAFASLTIRTVDWRCADLVAAFNTEIRQKNRNLPGVRSRPAMPRDFARLLVGVAAGANKTGPIAEEGWSSRCLSSRPSAGMPRDRAEEPNVAYIGRGQSNRPSRREHERNENLRTRHD